MDQDPFIPMTFVIARSDSDEAIQSSLRGLRAQSWLASLRSQ